MSQITQFISNNGAGGFVQTLTGNSGGPVPPTVGNINVVGGVGITVAGNPGTSTLTINSTGTTVLTYTLVNTTPYVVLPTDDFLGVDSSGMAIQINLPNAPATGRVFVIKDSTGSAAVHNITVTTVGGVILIDAAATYVMNTAYESIQVLFDGVNYQVF